MTATTINEAYRQGVADEYHRLTEWHSPSNELPEYDKTILIHFRRTNLLFESSDDIICTGHISAALTKVYGRPFWCFDDGTTDRYKIIGWREIHNL